MDYSNIQRNPGLLKIETIDSDPDSKIYDINPGKLLRKFMDYLKDELRDIYGIQMTVTFKLSDGFVVFNTLINNTSYKLCRVDIRTGDLCKINGDIIGNINVKSDWSLILAPIRSFAATFYN